MRSSTRRACCASTRLVSTCRGLSNAARMALGVISLKVTRKIFFGSMATTSFGSSAGSSFFTASSAFAVFFLNLETLGSCSMYLEGLESTIARCAEIASPSRSGSPARYTASAVIADLRRSLMTLPLPAMICRVGSKILSSSMLINFPGGISLAFARLLPFFALLFFSGQANAYCFLGQVHHVADGSFDGVIPPQVFVDRFRLCGRFHNNQRTCHLFFVTP